MSALTPTAANPLDTLGIELSSTSLQLPDRMRFNDWQRFGEQLQASHDANLWWIADWAAFGERQYARDYGAALEVLSRKTLYNLRSVAKKVESSRRRELLSFAHHAEVAALEPEEQDAWLNEAQRQGWSHKELREQLAAARPGRVASSPALTVRAIGDLYALCSSEAERNGVKPADWAADGLRWLAENGSPHLTKQAA